MARSGDIIENTSTGERMTFRRTAADGGVLEIEYAARAGAVGPPEHIHLDQEERFAVTAGTGCFRVGAREMTLRAGASAAVAAGTRHTFVNCGGGELRMTIEISPAKNMETFFETLFGLGRDGKLDKRGRGGLLQDAALAHVYGVLLPSPPPFVQRPGIALVAFIGRLFGKRASYERYSGRTKAPSRE
jgi:mannose-6-phosphate isomerase-like protein (cupin superfamily)